MRIYVDGCCLIFGNNESRRIRIIRRQSVQVKQKKEDSNVYGQETCIYTPTYSHITDLNATKQIDPTRQQQQNNSGLRIVSDVVDSSYRVFDGIGKFWQRNAQELENSKAMTGLVDRVRKVGDAAEPIIKERLSELKEMTTTTGKSPSVHSSDSSLLPSFMESRSNRSNSIKSKVKRILSLSL